MKRILMCTNIYPSPATPEMGSFVRNTFVKLGESLGEAEIVLVKKQFHQGRAGTLRSYLGFAATLWGCLFRRCDLMYAHMVFPTGWLCLPIARLRGIPLIVYAHGGDIVGANKREMHHWAKPGPFGFLNIVKAMTRITLREADRVHTCSAFLRDEAVRIFGVSQGKFLVASMGVPMDLFRPGAGAGPDPEARRTVLFVGRMTWQKGFDLFLGLADALRASHPGKYRFVCVGRCHDEGYLERVRSAPDMRHINGVDQSALPALYSEAYATVMPSRYEAFGLVAAESLSCGTPVLAMDIGGLAGIVRPGVNGFLFREAADLLERFRDLEKDYAAIQARTRDSAAPYDIRVEMGKIAADCRALLGLSQG